MKDNNKDSRRLMLIAIVAMMIVVCVFIYFHTRPETSRNQAILLSDFNRDLKDTPIIVNTYKVLPEPLDEAINCALILKKKVEANLHKDFYVNGKRKKDEKFLQRLFTLTFKDLYSHVDQEPNNGSGCPDFVFSQGSQKKTIVELKLASNSNLKHGLTSQVERYKYDINTWKEY